MLRCCALFAGCMVMGHSHSCGRVLLRGDACALQWVHTLTSAGSTASLDVMYGCVFSSLCIAAPSTQVLVQQLRLEVALLMAVRGDLSGLEDAAGDCCCLRR